MEFSPQTNIVDLMEFQPGRITMAYAPLVGRPYAYGLAVGGEKGVSEVLQNLIADVDLTLALSGRSTISEIDRSLLVKQ
ncbi:alpha-hydroxy-acid oxidizing protein [Aliibacillus thermotolerans]|uniref:Alpha-hydroxy-acid oxidizing protein n=1 Tax=Aliibacillus thermotolerans TaxID=1834418 RepID=A0ABW0U861_9BACI|nr:alpha-hydroxy-acid oxidizing protein [Aliibacillus thermotolerans]MDA3129606.1 hydroxyacid dehydrogenase [Aliibacillus thermotolerans]